MPQSTDDRLNELKQKYDTVLRLMEDSGIHLQNLQLMEGKLYLCGAAPSEGVRQRIVAAVEKADPGHSDIDLELVAQERGATQNYVVQPGDSLEEVSRKFYGTDSGAPRILEANAGKIPDPVRLEPGQTLVIPG
jgi:nucleoid-associated protein YgaU